MNSEALALFIEPTLFALNSPDSKQLRTVFAEVQAHQFKLEDELAATQGRIDSRSFELGVTHSFLEMLSTEVHRSTFKDAVRFVDCLEHGLTALHQVALLEGMNLDLTQGSIADRLNVDRGNFSRLAGKLVNKGLLTARRGRVVSYSLTPLGLDVLNELRPGWKACDPRTGTRLQSADQVSNAARATMQELEETRAQVHVRALEDVVTGRLSRAGYARRRMAITQAHALKTVILSGQKEEPLQNYVFTNKKSSYSALIHNLKSQSERLLGMGVHG